MDCLAHWACLDLLGLVGGGQLVLLDSLGSLDSLGLADWLALLPNLGHWAHWSLGLLPPWGLTDCCLPRVRQATPLTGWPGWLVWLVWLGWGLLPPVAG